MKLHWQFFFKAEQHHRLLKKLCRKIKADPLDSAFELSGNREKLSSCKFQIQLKASSWTAAVAESLEIGSRFSPHWSLTANPPKYIHCTTGECDIDGIEILSWHLSSDLHSLLQD